MKSNWWRHTTIMVDWQYFNHGCLGSKNCNARRLPHFEIERHFLTRRQCAEILSILVFAYGSRRRYTRLLSLINGLGVFSGGSNNTDAFSLSVDIYGELGWLKMMSLWSVSLDGCSMRCYIGKTEVKHSNNLYIAEG